MICPNCQHDLDADEKKDEIPSHKTASQIIRRVKEELAALVAAIEH